MKTIKTIKERVKKKVAPSKQGLAQALLREYHTEYKGAKDDYCFLPMWIIGYLCAMRDTGHLTWIEWQNLIDHYRDINH